MLLSNYFRNKKNSKKGFTLVEALCSVAILAIVFAGVLNSVAFSQQMIYTDNVRDKASDKAQLVADEMISICTGKDPDDANALTQIQNDIDSHINNANDPQFASVGQVTLVTGLTGVDAFNPAHNPMIQVTVTPVTESFDDEVLSGITTKSTTQSGWDITLRVYHQAIGGQDSWQATEVSAFAPYNHGE